MLRHKRKTFRSAYDLVTILERDEYEPDVTLVIGTGDAREIAVLKDAWPTCKMYGFEAHDRLAEQANDILPTWHVAIVADSSKAHVTFYRRQKMAMASSVYSKSYCRERPVKVPTMTIDEIRCVHRLAGKKVLLWMDCEGGELNALKGGMSLVTENRWLHLEVCPTPDRPGWPPAVEVDAWLRGQGYGAPVCHGLKRERHLSHDRTYRKP